MILPQKNTAVAPKSDVEKLHDYLIDRNPEGIKKVLLLNGYTTVSSLQQMQVAMLALVKSKGASAIEQLLSEHPDYEMIVADYLDKNPLPKKKQKAVPIAKKEITTSIQVDFNSMINLLMFLVLVWLVLKIFKSQ